MRVTRPALCLALSASVVATGAASAATKKPAPKPVCNLIVDAKGDGSGLTGDDPGLDVLSADVASNASAVTTVIRLAGAPVKAGNPNAPEGAAYYFSFTPSGAKTPVFLAAAVGLTGTEYSMGTVDSSVNGSTYTARAGAVTGSIKGSVVTVSVARSVLASVADVKPGLKLTGLKAEVFFPLEVPGVGGLLEQADAAVGSKAYLAGAASCVKP